MTLGIYFHIPFCFHKCGYCNFASGQFSSLSPTRYVDALLEELETSKDTYLSEEIQKYTIFIGGGTPSFLDIDIFKKLLKRIQTTFDPIIEWTIEANPNSLTLEKLEIFKSYGVTRMSLGVQSLNENELKFLERQHTPKQALEAIEKTQSIFPSSWNADFIYGLPMQTQQSWKKTLNEILRLNPNHLSLYELTYEPDTPLGQDHKKGRIHSLEDEKILEFQSQAEEILSKNKLNRYEISNYAIKGKQCWHNDNIWNGGNFLGFGNGAHGRLSYMRYRNTSSPYEYVEKISNHLSPKISQESDKTLEDRLTTALLLGLRRKAGLTAAQLVGLTKKNSKDLWGQKTAFWREWLDFDQGDLKCTKKGWNLIDRLVVELVEEASI